MSATPSLTFLKDSYFGGTPPLSSGVGWAVIIGFGVFFSVVTTLIVHLSRKYTNTPTTSEHFNTAGRSVKTGLTASVIVSQWTWAATLLQSSNVAWSYGVSGPFWYAAGATIQVLLFGVLAIRVKEIAPKAHTVCEMVRVRWGKVRLSSNSLPTAFQQRLFQRRQSFFFFMFSLSFSFPRPLIPLTPSICFLLLLLLLPSPLPPLSRTPTSRSSRSPSWPT